jgi:hypothetical protein
VKFHVVTTMNAAGYSQHGRRMVDSFLLRWPETASITVYAENFDNVVESERCHVRELPAWLTEFKFANAENPAAHGQRRGAYDYRYDAVKFAHKVAAMTDFGLGLDDGIMVWLDADTFFHADVKEDWLLKLFPEPAYIGWLDRKSSHPECGIILFRPSDLYHRRFMQAYEDVYTSGRIFKYGEWHDSFVFQQLVRVKAAAGKIPQPVSMSGDTRITHPAVNGPWGAVCDHMKGPRKEEGRSRARDFVRPRSEPYWTGA